MDMKTRDMSAYADVQLATPRDPHLGYLPIRIASTAVQDKAFTKQGTAMPFGVAAARLPGIRTRGGPD